MFFSWKVQSLESQEQNLLNKIKIFAIVIEKKTTWDFAFIMIVILEFGLKY